MLHTSLALLVGVMASQVDIEYGNPPSPMPLGPGAGSYRAPAQGYYGSPAPGFSASPSQGLPGSPSPGISGSMNPGFGPPTGPNAPAATPGPGAAPVPNTGAPTAPFNPGLEVRIEMRQPDWREYNFNGPNPAEQANQFADRARSMGYEVHLEHYRDRSRIACRMNDWTVYATVYRTERAQQIRSWLEGQGLETRAGDPRPSTPPTAPAIPPYGANRSYNSAGGQRFGLDPALPGNGLPQAW